MAAVLELDFGALDIEGLEGKVFLAWLGGSGLLGNRDRGVSRGLIDFGLFGGDCFGYCRLASCHCDLLSFGVRLPYSGDEIRCKAENTRVSCSGNNAKNARLDFACNKG
jgi:hypothetical protein